MAPPGKGKGDSPIVRETVRPAIRAACQRALSAREEIVATYPEWELWREEAHRLKSGVIAELDANLAELTRQVESWGGVVHQAADVAQARELILKIARRHGVQAVVKSKSMTTEEIGLNPALVAAGLQVTETDLGEFIVQLTGEAPAHITAPAMHCDRHQIAALFATHLELSCPPEPVLLSRAGAEHLRPRFGEAQMGITGVNFAAVDSGTLIMVENEGNLRQCAAVPPVHLAVMGLEKMLPSVTDLAVLLRLLPASATGQRLTAYVNLVRGLKAQSEGRQAFYLILVDNGRRTLAAHPRLREALYCLRCGACLNVCPIFQVGGGHLYGQVYPGAIGILLAPFLSGGDLTELCTQCGACSLICPAKIPLADHILYLRREGRRHPLKRTLVAAATAILARPALYRSLEGPGRILYDHLPAPLAARLWGADRALPKLAPRSYHRLTRDRTAGEGS